MNALTPFELTLLNSLVEKYPAVAAHIPYLVVSDRDYTGVGLYVNFCDYNLPDATYLLKDISSQIIGVDQRIILPQLKHGLCYVAFLTEGKIAFLEIVSYDEAWDGNVDKFSLENL